MSYRIQVPFPASLLCVLVAAASAGPAMAEAPLSKEASVALSTRIMHFPRQLQARAAVPGHLASRRDEFEKSYDLYIRYTDGTIYNPSTRVFDKVRLRAYQQPTDKSWDVTVDGAARFQAPTVVMVPGQTVRFKLFNQLPEQILPGTEPPRVPYVECPATALNAPLPNYCFNVTNLHSHGLWVSPTGNSDNVLLSIEPSVNFEYEYNVPVDHPTGTFWYHPHIHGTTAVQVGSGMEGALVIEGARAPTETENGDLDTMLKKFQPAGGAAGEVLLLQQIPYACKVSGSSITDWSCTTSETGVVENFQQVGPGSAWKNSGRYTTVDGQVQPTFPMVSKTVYRWRIIDGGFQSTVTFGIKKADPVQLDKFLKGEKIDLETVCNGFDVTQFEVAADGLTHGKTIVKTLNLLQSGYRSDILFSLPEDGHYCVYDKKGTNDLNPSAKATQLLGVINAAKNPNTGIVEGVADQQKFLTAQLKAAANYQPASVQAQVIADLDDNLKLSKFVPHPTITQAEIDASHQPVEPIVFSDPNGAFSINGKEYQPEVVSHTLILGTAQAWNLSSLSGSHPYHIHVNPFQIVNITPKACTSSTDTNPYCKPAGSTEPDEKYLDPQYKDMVGTWKDTLLVTQDVNIGIRTRYQRYIGEFVLHCHILGHEDRGMMQNVKVVVPNSKGEPSGGAHSGHAMK